MESYWHHVTPEVYSLPAHLNPHPHCWSRDDVTIWAEWCRKEFALDMKASNFSMNGKALCMLTKDDFKERSTEAGDVLYNTLQILLTRVAYSDSSRWRGPVHLGHPLPLDLMLPPAIEYGSLFRSPYGQAALPLCDSRSPPTSPMGGNLLVHSPGSPPQALPSPRFAFQHGGYLPWDYRTSHQRPGPLCSSPDSDKQDSSDAQVKWKTEEDADRAGDYTNKTPTNEDDRNYSVDVCTEPKKHSTSPPQSIVKSTVYDKQKSLMSPSVQVEAYPMIVGHADQMKANGRIAMFESIDQVKANGRIAVFENRPETYHVVKMKDEPEDVAKHCSIDGDRQMASSYDRISPPSSPEQHVLPSPVEEERVSPQQGMMDGPAGVQNDGDASSWSGHFPNSVPYIKGSRKLWEFLWGLMENPAMYKTVIRWEDKTQGVFRILNTGALAQLWGRQKNKNNMTYEKMSRALRYYYRMNILNKVPGKRLTYRFAKDPNGINDMKRLARMNRGSQEGGEMDR